MGKKSRQQQAPREDANDDNLVDDEFGVEAEREGGRKEGSIKKQRPMKDVFNQILQEEQAAPKKPRKNKKIKKQAPENQQFPKDQPKQQKAPGQKSDQAFKYVRNKALEEDLRTKTLSGVIKVMNLISAHKRDTGQQ